jgi:hypothetical protein
MLIQPGNSKMGGVANYSMRAKASCPGRTPICDAFCYAAAGRFNASNVMRTHDRNLAESRRADFARRVIDEITKMKLELLRVHVAGDFYDEAYIDKWIQIAKACPNTKFYAYTRSWRVAELVPALRRLARCPNFQLWLSADRDSHRFNGRPPAHTRRAGMLHES